MDEARGHWLECDGTDESSLLSPSPPSRDDLSATHLAFPSFHLPDGRVRIPTTLPPSPDFLPVQLNDLDVDDELAQSGTTLEFILTTLNNSAHTLIQASQETRGQDSEPFTSPESAFPLLRCTRPPAPLPLPTHVLELQFADTGERYRTPVHGLLWALQSPTLPQLCRRFVLSSSPRGGRNNVLALGITRPTLSTHIVVDGPAGATLENNELILPLVTFALPCRAAWPLLHRFLYDGSAAELLNGLLAPPDPLPPRPLNSVSASQPMSSSTVPLPIGNPTAAAAPSSSEFEPNRPQPVLDSVLVRLMRVREVWLDAYALELSNRHLWETLERAYTTLVAELRDAAADLPGCAVPPMVDGLLDTHGSDL